MLLFVSAVITKKKSHSQATYLVVVSCVGELEHLGIKRHRCEKGKKSTMFLLQEKKTPLGEWGEGQMENEKLV